MVVGGETQRKVWGRGGVRGEVGKGEEEGKVRGGAGIVGVIALAPAKLICIYWGGGGNPVVSFVLLVYLLGREGQSCYPLTALHSNDN